MFSVLSLYVPSVSELRGYCGFCRQRQGTRYDLYRHLKSCPKREKTNFDESVSSCQSEGNEQLSAEINRLKFELNKNILDFEHRQNSLLVSSGV